MKGFIISLHSFIGYTLLWFSTLAPSISSFRVNFNHHRQRQQIPLTHYLFAIPQDPSINDNNKDDDNNDTEFMKDFQKAKNEKIGVPLDYAETEEARNAAIDAENSFLAAMRQVKEEFQRSKEELGSADKAIDLLKNKWDMEDSLRSVSDEDLDEKGEFE